MNYFDQEIYANDNGTRACLERTLSGYFRVVVWKDCCITLSRKVYQTYRIAKRFIDDNGYYIVARH